MTALSKAYSAVEPNSAGCYLHRIQTALFINWYFFVFFMLLPPNLTFMLYYRLCRQYNVCAKEL